MQTGIIGGTGAEGRGIAARLAAAGVSVLVGSRQLDRARETVHALCAGHASLPLTPATNREIVDRSDVIFLAVPFDRAGDILAEHRSRFRPATRVVDVTVPLAFRDGAPIVIDLPEGSASEFIRARLPDEVQLAGALKTVPASALAQLDAPLDCDDFVCGDSAAVREATIALLQRIPTLRPIDAGGLEAARAIERMTALAIAINRRYKARASRFRIVGLRDGP